MDTDIRENAPMSHTWLRKPAVLEKLGVGTTMLYQLMRHDDFPCPLKLGRASVWSAQEIDAWLAERMAERDEARGKAAAT
jgi:predicted DNA-binding transcriptional regulator AlpA